MEVSLPMHCDGCKILLVDTGGRGKWQPCKVAVGYDMRGEQFEEMLLCCNCAARAASFAISCLSFADSRRLVKFVKAERCTHGVTLTFKCSECGEARQLPSPDWDTTAERHKAESQAEMDATEPMLVEGGK